MKYTPVNSIVMNLLAIKLSSPDGFNSAEAEFHIRTNCLNRFNAKIFKKAEELSGR